MGSHPSLREDQDILQWQYGDKSSDPTLMGLLSRHGSSAGTKKASSTQQMHNLPPQHNAVDNRHPTTEASKSSRKWGWPLIFHGSNTSKTFESSGRAEMPARLQPPVVPTRKTSCKTIAEPENLVKPMSRRSKLLKSSASKLSLRSNLSTSTMWSTQSKEPERSSRSRTREYRGPLQTPGSSSRISSPTRFQHLTHAVPAQFTRISGATQSDLIADFSALRAAQASRRDFRGIKTVDLHSRNPSDETNPSSSTVSSIVSSSKSSAIVSLGSESSFTSSSSAEKLSQSISSINASKSRESFSQPLSAENSPSIGTGNFSMTPPPRTSSRKTLKRSEQKIGHRDSDTFTNPSLNLSKSQSYQQHHDNQASFTEGNENFVLVENSFSSSLGKPLPCVAEETASRASSPYSYVQERHAYEEYQGRWLRPTSQYPRSSSRDSSNTITPTHSPQPQSDKPLPPLPKASIPYKEVEVARKVFQRSSLTEGLFTSWSFDEDEPEEFSAKLGPNPFFERPYSQMSIRSVDRSATSSPNAASLRNQTPTPTQHLHLASLHSQSPASTPHAFQPSWSGSSNSTSETSNDKQIYDLPQKQNGLLTQTQYYYRCPSRPRSAASRRSESRSKTT